MTDLTTLALQTAHYRDVQARLYGPKALRVLPLPPKSKPPPTAPLKPCKSIRDAILTLRSATSRAVIHDATDPIRLATLMRITMKVTGVPSVDFFSARRWGYVAEARQLYFWLAWKYTTASSPNIGRHCGRKHYSTVLHGIKKIDQSLKAFGKDSKWQARIDACLVEMGE
jgi:Bacterial dnaA protein helix-turn-helix